MTEQTFTQEQAQAMYEALNHIANRTSDENAIYPNMFDYVTTHAKQTLATLQAIASVPAEDTQAGVRYVVRPMPDSSNTWCVWDNQLDKLVICTGQSSTHAEEKANTMNKRAIADNTRYIPTQRGNFRWYVQDCHGGNIQHGGSNGYELQAEAQAAADSLNAANGSLEGES